MENPQPWTGVRYMEAPYILPALTLPLGCYDVLGEILFVWISRKATRVLCCVPVAPRISGRTVVWMVESGKEMHKRCKRLVLEVPQRNFADTLHSS